ncbi:MAG: triose-phosphate isomerase [Firmicutes bacterium]|nr:triose-phosphate isomerase [Bacillota bacterium]
MKIIAANWKLNKTNAEAREFFAQYKKLVTSTPNKVIVCAPFTTLGVEIPNGVELGAQNLHYAKSGTFTGEISAEMLVEAGVKYVLVGHSERRAAPFSEDNEFLNAKVKSAQAAGLTPILCIGESLEVREEGATENLLKWQLTTGLKDITDTNLIVAYEPVWAISGGDPTKPKPIATREQIAEVHAFIKDLLQKQFKTDIPVLYGGSANDQNMHDIFPIPGVDGGLIGGAALVPEKFAKLANYK